MCSSILKYLFNAQSYARLVTALGSNLSSLSDSAVAPYADNYFEFDSSQRVTKEIVQGQGCSSCSGGQGTYLFAYSTSAFAPKYYPSPRLVSFRLKSKRICTGDNP